uniref:TAP42-like protein n=1 Tax=Odontella aurita TaxID=265563 RepID=A0A7S4HLI0_9STRA|eukprot:CAMPEP_0113566862 /NCGR_PEP_ID=MMETSP0015_2-20120614/22957_1 /TAXON_ID=2838 /ORGANISM="Odontella" /LENGTH=405 /DNA_ID=CAMNT_0000469195 /DNA_START=41 /DNA_END=1258 /DNA_ORIENTATION=- /assembly_acc=CAM_ASM_000160
MVKSFTEDAASSSVASNGNSSQPPTSLSASLTEATALISAGKPDDAVPLLASLQERISTSALFSSNESLEDVATSSLPPLAVEFHLASAVMSLRTSSSVGRRSNVVRSSELFHAFLRTLDDLGDILGPDLAKDYRVVLDEEADGNGGDSDAPATRGPPRRSAPENRDAKIARFRARKAAEEERARLSALRERRGRMGLDDEEELDGHDMEGVNRSLAIADLRRMAAEALDEIRSGAREMEMLEMAVQMEQMRAVEGRYRPSGQGGDTPHVGPSPPGRRPPHPQNGRGMQVTRVTQDPVTGQLQLKKEEIKSQVFRPGWNQPTMSLAEYGDREVTQAIEREARQKVAEEENKGKPRRYEQLVRDGMEDDANLVDASAKLDRDWDDWKDENPRGSGNKMADKGDRNF